jgi:hypothetical protein
MGMTEIEGRRAVLEVIAQWLDRRMPVTAFINDYWTVRRSVMDGNLSAFSGKFGQLMDGVDGAVTVFSPEEDRATFELDEKQLRADVGAIYRKVLSEMPELVAKD